MGNIEITPLLPLWILLAAFGLVLVLLALDLAHRRKNNKLTKRWFLIPALVLSLAGVAINPGMQTTVTGEKMTESGEQYVSEFDVVFVVDTTSSIAAEDWGDGKTRLDGVKADINTIVGEYPSARFAIITFDRTASLRVPMTTDSSSVISSANTLRQEATGNSRGSTIGEAADLLTSTLASNKADEERNVLVFFFSDGENTSSDEQASFEASKPFISSGAVLGYGTEEGGKMKRRDGYNEPGVDYITDVSGKPGVSQIDEDNLKKVAKELGVKYIHRTADTPLNVTANAEGSDIGDIEATTTKTDQFYWMFALASMLILATMLYIAARGARKLTTGLGRNRKND